MKLLAGGCKNLLVVVLVLLCARSARSQDARIPLEQLDRLSNHAANTVEVALDERLLQLAAKFLNKNDPGQAKAKELVAGLKGIYVRVYSFDKPGEYAASELEPLRAWVRGNRWQKIVGVRSRTGDNLEVHLNVQGDHFNGLAIFSAQPKELVVVNILGPIDLEKLSQLEGQFGIPKLDLEKASKPKPKQE